MRAWPALWALFQEQEQLQGISSRHLEKSKYCKQGPDLLLGYLTEPESYRSTSCSVPVTAGPASIGTSQPCFEVSIFLSQRLKSHTLKFTRKTFSFGLVFSWILPQPVCLLCANTETSTRKPRAASEAPSKGTASPPPRYNSTKKQNGEEKKVKPPKSLRLPRIKESCHLTKSSLGLSLGWVHPKGPFLSRQHSWLQPAAAAASIHAETKLIGIGETAVNNKSTCWSSIWNKLTKITCNFQRMRNLKPNKYKTNPSLDFLGVRRGSLGWPPKCIFKPFVIQLNRVFTLHFPCFRPLHLYKQVIYAIFT